MAHWRVSVAAAILAVVANAAPSIEFPLNSQVPPVARVSEPYSYAFSESTFFSTLPMNYVLSSGPKWLSLDGDSRTLLGTPSASDVGPDPVTGVPIELTAIDSSGSITLNATLVISKNQGPVIQISASEQLASFGDPYSFPSTILLHPSSSFNFHFEPNTFTESESSNLSYYAVTLDNTPLPSWITFDGSSLLFNGTTPDYSSLIQPPQTFGIQLIASDVEGFSAASIPLEIIVGVHVLAFSEPSVTVNSTAGISYNYDGLASNLHIDGHNVSASNLSSIIAQTPDWMTFDNTTFALSGTPPADLDEYNITIIAIDTYGDTANATIQLSVAIPIFNGTPMAVNATIGQDFSYNISAYLQNMSEVSISAQITPATSWLVFNPQTFILSGDVPSNTKPSRIKVTLAANLKDSNSSTSESFIVNVVSNNTQLASTSTSTARVQTSTSLSPSAITSSGSNADKSSHKRINTNIVAAVIIPLVLLLAVVLVFLFCCRKKRGGGDRSSSPNKSEISGPIGTTSRTGDMISHVVPMQSDLQESYERNESTGSSEGYANKRRHNSEPPAFRSFRQSRTASAISGMVSSSLADYSSSETKARSQSDNMVSLEDRSWRTTQDSVYPPVKSSTSSSHRMTRNYSRKGFIRDSTRLSLDHAIGERASSSLPAAEGLRLNSGESQFSFVPSESMLYISKHSSIQRTPDLAYSRDMSRRRLSARRRSKLGLNMERRRSGIGHGRYSIPSTYGDNWMQRGVGHGQNRSSVESGSTLARNSKTWQTISSDQVKELNRQRSGGSNPSESTELLYPENSTTRVIRQVPRSPIAGPSNYLSTSSTNSRPMSRRTTGSSPFFGGSTRKVRNSLHSKNNRASLPDSPTLPQLPLPGELEKTIIRALRDDEDGDQPHDSLGISYGSAREGTRQLKSYLDDQIANSRTWQSRQSNESGDSRFESAVDSLPSVNHPAKRQETKDDNDEAHEDYEYYYLPDSVSGESWEAPHPNRDSKGRVIEYADEDSPKVVQAAARQTVKPNLVPQVASRPRRSPRATRRMQIGDGSSRARYDNRMNFKAYI